MKCLVAGTCLTARMETSTIALKRTDSGQHCNSHHRSFICNAAVAMQYTASLDSSEPSVSSHGELRSRAKRGGKSGRRDGAVLSRGSATLRTAKRGSLSKSKLFAKKAAATLPIPADVLVQVSYDEQALWEQEIVTQTTTQTALLDPNRRWGGTCGSSLWCASIALVQWLSKAQQEEVLSRHIVGRNVIELGAGLGLTGIFLAQNGARRVCLTDQPQQVPLLTRNINANRCALSRAKCSVRAAALEWGGALPPSIAAQSWDLVVATDVVYDADDMPALAESIGRLLKSGGPDARAILALPDRTEFGLRERSGDLRFDYELLIEELSNKRGSCRQIGRISSEEAGTVHSEIHVLLCRLDTHK